MPPRRILNLREEDTLNFAGFKPLEGSCCRTGNRNEPSPRLHVAREIRVQHTHLANPAYKTLKSSKRFPEQLLCDVARPPPMRNLMLFVHKLPDDFTLRKTQATKERPREGEIRFVLPVCRENVTRFHTRRVPRIAVPGTLPLQWHMYVGLFIVGQHLLRLC